MSGSLIEELTRLIEIKQESWELHHSAGEIAAACIDMCRQHDTEQRVVVPISNAQRNHYYEIASFLEKHGRKEWAADVCKAANTLGQTGGDNYEHGFRTGYAQGSRVVDLTEEEKREAVEAIKAEIENHGYQAGKAGFCFSAKEAAPIALSALLERFELRRRG